MDTPFDYTLNPLSRNEKSNNHDFTSIPYNPKHNEEFNLHEDKFKSSIDNVNDTDNRIEEGYYHAYSTPNLTYSLSSFSTPNGPTLQSGTQDLWGNELYSSPKQIPNEVWPAHNFPAIHHAIDERHYHSEYLREEPIGVWNSACYPINNGFEESSLKDGDELLIPAYNYVLPGIWDLNTENQNQGHPDYYSFQNNHTIPYYYHGYSYPALTTESQVTEQLSEEYKQINEGYLYDEESSKVETTAPGNHKVCKEQAKKRKYRRSKSSDQLAPENSNNDEELVFSLPPISDMPLEALEVPTHLFSTLPSIKTRKPKTKSKLIGTFLCDHENCGKTFTRPYNLKAHTRIHTQERPFTCSVCSYSFSRLHDMKRHMNLHSGVKPFNCIYCAKSFARLDALNRHIKKDSLTCSTVTRSKALRQRTK